MRYLIKPVLMAPVLLAAVPAAAQVSVQAPVYGAPIPAPGTVYAPPPAVSANPPFIAGAPAVPQSIPTAGARVWQNGRWMALPPNATPNFAQNGNHNRWGGMIGGHWYAGVQAPGGWGGYRRLGRGHRLPNYWMSASFGIPDYLSFGLAAPPYGYHWVRYYDDAVLVDAQGNVWDSVDGIGWGGGVSVDAGAAYANSYSSSYASVGGGYRQPIQPVDPNAYYGYSGGSAPPVAYAPPAVQAAPAYGYGYGAGSYYQSGATYYGAPAGSTVVITTTPITTTTVVEETIEEEETVTTSYVRSAPRRVVHRAPRRAVHRAPVRHRAAPRCCVCGCR